MYALICVLKGDVKTYQQSLIDKVADEFGVLETKNDGLPPHFTLKYWFTDIEAVEKLLQRFCSAHSPTKVVVGGIGSFPPKVVFLKVQPSADAKTVFHDLLKELRKIPDLEWRSIEGEKLTFHATIAEGCDEQYEEIMNFLKSEHQHFDCMFDNIAVLEASEKLRKGWKIRKTFRMLS